MEQQFDSLTKCFFCEGTIFDAYVLKVDGQYWHSSCLKCDDCGALLSERCFKRHHKLLCFKDYERQKRCFKCGNEIRADEFMQKSTFFDQEVIYHLLCFNCAFCATNLSSGTKYVMTDEGQLKCANCHCGIRNLDEVSKQTQQLVSCCDVIGQDSDASANEAIFRKEIKEENSLHSNPDFDWMNSSNVDEASLPDSGEFGLSTFGVETNLSSQDFSNDLGQRSPDKFEGGKTISPSNINVKTKSGKRHRGPRTTIKPTQLTALKTAFEISHKPSKSVRESLAKKTGLEMRVIQVWFQNRRSKERRVSQANVNKNQNFYNGSIEQKYRSHHHFPFLNSHIHDRHLFYPSKYTSSTARNSHFSGPVDGTSWIHSNSNGLHCNFQSEIPVVTSYCGSTIIEKEPHTFRSIMFQREGVERGVSETRPCSESNMIFDLYHAKLEQTNLWPNNS